MNRLTKKITSLFLAAAVTVGCGALPVSALDNGSTGDSYLDGVYQGTGYGHLDGKIVLDVTISGGEIEKVELVSQEEQSYWDDWGLESLFPEIVKQNSPDVDGITGATESSEGIKNAVRDALSKASAPVDQDADVTAVLGSGVNTEQAASVVYGGQTWNVIGYQGQGVASDSGNLTLLMKGNLGVASFDTDFDCDYATSTLRSTLNKLAAGQTVGKLTPLSFSGAEKGRDSYQNAGKRQLCRRRLLRRNFRQACGERAGLAAFHQGSTGTGRNAPHHGFQLYVRSGIDPLVASFSR